MSMKKYLNQIIYKRKREYLLLISGEHYTLVLTLLFFQRAVFKKESRQSWISTNHYKSGWRCAFVVCCSFVRSAHSVRHLKQQLRPTITSVNWREDKPRFLLFKQKKHLGTLWPLQWVSCVVGRILLVGKTR